MLSHLKFGPEIPAYRVYARCMVHAKKGCHLQAAKHLLNSFFCACALQLNPILLPVPGSKIT
jgi:hypothetical protein